MEVRQKHFPEHWGHGFCSSLWGSQQIIELCLPIHHEQTTSCWLACFPNPSTYIFCKFMGTRFTEQQLSQKSWNVSIARGWAAWFAANSSLWFKSIEIPCVHQSHTWSKRLTLEAWISLWSGPQNSLILPGVVWQTIKKDAHGFKPNSKRHFGNKMQQAAAHQPALKHDFGWTTLSSRSSRCMSRVHFVDVWDGQITVMFISQQELMINSITAIGSNWSPLPNNLWS